MTDDLAALLRAVLDTEGPDWPDALVTNVHADDLAVALAEAFRAQGLTVTPVGAGPEV